MLNAMVDVTAIHWCNTLCSCDYTSWHASYCISFLPFMCSLILQRWQNFFVSLVYWIVSPDQDSSPMCIDIVFGISPFAYFAVFTQHGDEFADLFIQAHISVVFFFSFWKTVSERVLMQRHWINMQREVWIYGKLAWSCSSHQMGFLLFIRSLFFATKTSSM